MTKRLIKFIAFFVILCLILIFFQSLLTNRRFDDFTADKEWSNLPRNSIDVLFLGSSEYVRGISPNIIWANSGIASYVRGTSSMKPQIQYLLLADSLKTQTPKICFIDATFLLLGVDVDQEGGYLHVRTDEFSLSKTKIEVIRDIVDDGDKQYWIEYLFPLAYNHYRWKELTKENTFYGPEVISLGQMMSNSDTINGPWSVPYNESFARYESGLEPDARMCELYTKTINLCKKNGITPILYKSPDLKLRKGLSDGIEKFAKRTGIEFVDFDKGENREELSLTENDFFDTVHLNHWGAAKWSLMLSRWIRKNYDFADYRKVDGEIKDAFCNSYEKYYDRFAIYMPEDLSPLENVLSGVSEKIVKEGMAEKAVRTIYEDAKRKVNSKLEENKLINMGTILSATEIGIVMENLPDDVYSESMQLVRGRRYAVNGGYMDVYEFPVSSNLLSNVRQTMTLTLPDGSVESVVVHGNLVVCVSGIDDNHTLQLLLYAVQDASYIS